ncbi:MAG TPA: hypothetical protein VMX14_13490 [Anaerolineae bacterium]|nr:hypothetical protein [Anaerolineae bacterium]
MGAPANNKNAQTHGLYSTDPNEPSPDSLQEILDRLKKRLARLERYLDDNWDDLEPDQITRITAQQGQTASRIARIERDLRKTGAEQGEEDDFTRAINEALDRLGAEWGITL